MKKILSLLLVCLMFFGIIPETSFASDDVSVYLFGEKLEFDVPPQIINSRTLVPMRVIFEELGAQVDWNGETQTVTSTKGDKTIILTVGSYTMYVNSKEVTLDVAPIIIDQRAMVPARAVSESFDLKVDWDGGTRSVLITKPDSQSSLTPDEAYDMLKAIIVLTGQHEEGQYSDDEAYDSYVVSLNDYITMSCNMKSQKHSEYLLVTARYPETKGVQVQLTMQFKKGLSPNAVISFTFEDQREYIIEGHFYQDGYLFDKGEFIADESDFSYEDTQIIIKDSLPYLFETVDQEITYQTTLSIKNLGVEY